MCSEAPEKTSAQMSTIHPISIRANTRRRREGLLFLGTQGISWSLACSDSGFMALLQATSFDGRLQRFYASKFHVSFPVILVTLRCADGGSGHRSFRHRSGHQTVCCTFSILLNCPIRVNGFHLSSTSSLARVLMGSVVIALRRKPGNLLPCWLRASC